LLEVTDRETDRHTNRQADRQTSRQTNQRRVLPQKYITFLVDVIKSTN